MAFNQVGQYVANHKSWDHVGNVVAPAEYSEGFRPHGHFKPAAWLPVQFFEKYYENWYVLMPGKAVAFDNDGRVVPAGYGVSGASVVYTSNDVDAGVVDVTTGLPVTSAKTVAVSDINGITYHFMGRSGVGLEVSAAVGVCPQPYLQWAGDGSALDTGYNPAALRQHNYNMQHQVAFLCDYVLELPLVPAVTSAANLTVGSFSNNLVTFNALGNLPVATNTMRTPLTFANGTVNDAASVFVTQVDTLAEVTGSGKWHIDYDTGVVTAWRATSPGGGNVYTLTYSHYASAPTGSNVSKFACVLGDVKPGDFLTVNVDSNWVVDSAPGIDSTLGQVLEVVVPEGLLGKVRTAYTGLGTNAAGSKPGYAGQMDQMPGTATGGVSDKVHYAGAADKVVRINLISR